jgi:hypothetical protein
MNSWYLSTNLYGIMSQKVHDLLPPFVSYNMEASGFSERSSKKYGGTSQKQPNLRPLLYSLKMEASGSSVTLAHVYQILPIRLECIIHSRDVTYLF